MKRILFTIAALCLITTVASAGWQSRDSNYNVKIVASGGGYSGPGDIVSGAIGFWSCSRAYNAAYATGANNACDLVDTATGLTTYTMKILTTGFADVAGAAASSACAVSCSIKKMYDQTGHGLDMTSPTGNVADFPVFVFNFSHSVPCASFNAANVQQLATANVPTTAQPITFSGVTERTANFTFLQTVLVDSGFALAWLYNNAPNQAYFYAGTAVFNPTASDSVLHAMQAIFNDPTSSTYIDGTDSGSQTFGTGSFGGTSQLQLGMRGASTQALTGFICEAGVFPSAFNATQKSNMNANQHSATVGYNF